MGLSYADAVRLGIGDLHPAACGGKSKERELLDRLALESHPASTRAAVESDGLNKLERSFRDNVLEPAYCAHRVARYWREPVKLRLGGRCWYCPDFLVEVASGEHGLPPRLVFVEVKGGFFRDDAKVKTKVAAADYPCFGWLLVTRPRRGEWEARAVTSRGIGRDVVEVAWM